ncbi:cryptochrome/photolyase family protein [Streptomyces lunaelactis]|uniref:cryptochrome/photolyase family protein n=2 Tax=Streptomyces lunaelactis TaxID=1535768 RepID=UPI001584F8DD|nr:deoxyribodipyrimidine photo-lyase [Streptomyces lunaelactis]NUK25486.1 deoxyribodipyrimidine photo-lyase [Streptomyces lunaelactis]
MSVAVMLFTSDLRLHDQPALRAAVRGTDAVVPLFVLDPGIRRSGFDAPNRRAFLADCLASLDAGLHERGGRLVIRIGGVVEQVCRVVVESGARSVHIAAGFSAYAVRREERLREALTALRCVLHVHDGVSTALPPGQVTPADRDHFAVFAPYFNSWQAAGLRETVAAPDSVPVPELAGHPLPKRTAVTGVSPGLAKGGEREGRRRLSAWLADGSAGIGAYEERQNDLAGDASSRLSPHLHFGTLSATELVHRARREGGPAADAFVRQLAWRDFHHQVLAARPDAAHADYRARGDHWRGDEKEIDAWKEGRTGCPIVDAAMRHLLYEGWMPGRGRLLAASYLTKTLYVDWRIGARHFLDLLVDGDIADNQLNWQWVAGTGTDTRPNRVLDPLAQAKRIDPHGDYVRRWVPELAHLAAPAIHQPWKLDGLDRARLDYPDPLVDQAEGRARFERARGLG